jgi:thiol-disulfide isomerase/thioredoxin
MGKNTIFVSVGVATLLVVTGGGYALKRHNDSNKAHEAFMMHEAFMEKKSAETDVMKKTEEADAMKKDEAVMTGDAMTKGGYISYSDYTSSQGKYKDFKVVLYFHAPWCPTCQALDKNINANLDSIPAKTIIVKTDYDSSNELKKKYGVTYQHTLVQVDSSGSKIKKWSGSPELKDLTAEIQT